MNCRTRTNYDGLIPVPPHRWHLTTLSPFLRVPFPSQFLHGFFSPALFCMVSSHCRSPDCRLEPRATLLNVRVGVGRFCGFFGLQKTETPATLGRRLGSHRHTCKGARTVEVGDRSAKHAQQWNCPVLITVQNCTTAFNRLWIKRYNSTFRCRRNRTPSVQFCTDSAPIKIVRIRTKCVRSTIVRSAHSAI